MNLNNKILTILEESEEDKNLFKPRRMDRITLPRKIYQENKINHGNFSLKNKEDLGPKSIEFKKLVRFVLNFIKKFEMPIYFYSLNKRILTEEEIQEQIDGNWRNRYSIHVNLHIRCGFPKDESILESIFFNKILNQTRNNNFELELFEMNDMLNIDVDYSY